MLTDIQIHQLLGSRPVPKCSPGHDPQGWMRERQEHFRRLLRKLSDEELEQIGQELSSWRLYTGRGSWRIEIALNEWRERHPEEEYD